MLEFTITPNNPNDDYDFGLWNVTGGGCQTIYAGTTPIRCNFSPDTGQTGISSTQTGNTWEQSLQVQAGQTYMLNVSNYSSTQSGYTLSFSTSTNSISIRDTIPPHFSSASNGCTTGTDSIVVLMSEPVTCSSLAADGSDFTLSPAVAGVSIVSASASNCAAGGTASTAYRIKLSGTLPNGTYTLTSKTGTDGNTLLDNCGNAQLAGDAVSFVVGVPPPPIYTLIRPVTCSLSRALFSLDLPTIGTYSLQIKNQAGTSVRNVSAINGQQIDSLAAGTYTATITSAAGGCTGTLNFVIAPAVVPVVSATYTVGCTTNLATATATVTSGIAPFTYSWNTSPVQTTATATSLSSGNYTVTVRGANNCTGTATVNVSQPTVLLGISFGKTDVSCNGGNDGTATANVSGGASPYTYSWNTSPVQTTAAISGLANGTYTVTVTDANNCTKTDSVTITQPANALSSSTTKTNVSCNGGNDGTATVAANGGTSPYSYSWSDGQTTATATNLSAGTYTVTTTDANGCTQTATVTLAQPDLLDVTATTTDVSCNGGTNGTATATVTGGTTPYSYSWDTNPIQTTATISGLAAGGYTVTVTDAKNCTDFAFVNVGEPAPLTISTAQTDLSCTSGNIGSATATPSGGTAPYTYSWDTNPVQTTATINGLGLGTYTVTVTDANNCTETASVTIIRSIVLVVSAVPTDVSCYGLNDGMATANVSGGGMPYSYSWNTTPVQTTQTATNLAPGRYTVTVVDAGGCTDTASTTITEPTQLTASATGTNLACGGTSSGTATVTATGGTAPYSYSWSDGQTTATATNLLAGTHTATVTDARGCVQTATVTLTEPPPFVTSTTQTNVSCNGGNNGTATVTASGAAPPYRYSWNTTPVKTTATITNLSAGTYTVTITDATNCTTTESVTITEPAPLGISISQTDVTCNGAGDGTATAVVSGGTQPYAYTWRTTSATPVIIGNADVQGGLTPGTYRVSVSDAGNCSVSATVTITQPTALTAFSTRTNVSCNGGNDGTSTVNPSGGTAPYTYSWSDGQTTATATNLSAGSYTATVTDANGCTVLLTRTITEPPAIVVSTTQTNVFCNGGNNGRAIATASGTRGPATFSWNTTPVQTNDTATNLSAGTYTVTVTDSLGCTQTQTVTITEPAVLDASITQTDVLCNGGSNGTASVNVNGGTAPYTYSWNTTPVQTTASIGNLSAGTYTVTVTDAQNCTQTDTVTLLQPTIALGITTTQTNVSCNGESTGTAMATVTNGTAPYSYAWNTTPAQTTDTVDNLAAGSYTLTVTDANGCTQTAVVNITEPPVLTTSVAITNISCNGLTDGVATVTAGGGAPPYSYSWSTTPAQTTTSISGLAAGVYTVTVKDSSGCVQIVSETVVEPAPLSLSTTQTNISCNGGNNGTITVSASGGTPPFSYLWNTTPAQTSATASNLVVGSYMVTVTDARGCTQTTSATLTEPAVLNASATGTNVSCNGGTNGTATVTATGGTTPYSYSWNTTPAQTTATAGALVAGTYTATVTDANGCSDTSTTTITQPTALTASATGTNVSCNGGTNGTATVTASGGTAPYTYSWNTTPAQTTASISGLTAGSYTATVTDAKGCTQTATVTILQPAALTASVTQTNITCNGGMNGTAMVTASGGTAPYSYAWNTTPTQTTVIISTLAAGSYIATVTDAKGCSDTATATITEPAVLTATVTGTNVSCNGGSNGTATVNATGGTAPYTYSWNTIPAQTTATASALTAGTYRATVTDANGCTQADTTTITQPTLLNFSTSQTDVSCNGGTNGTATAVAYGGTSPYIYSWNTTPLQTTPTITTLIAGTYTATVTDANNCIQTATFTIVQPTSLTASATGTDVSCNGGTTGTATVTAGGGTPPYAYSWNTTPAQTTASISGLSIGSYTVTVTDANGCTQTATVTITEPIVLAANIVQTDVSCNGGTNGTATVTASGGTTPYTYSWNTTPVQTTQTASGLPAGSYTATVTDVNGCAQTATATITEPPFFTYWANGTFVSCYGGNDGTYIVYPSGATPPYTYSWNTTPVQTTQMATNLTAGTYIVTITDANGCIYTRTAALLSQPTPVVLTTTQTDVSCNGGNNGTATVAATGGGLALYTYSWNTTPVQTTATASGLSAGTYTATVTNYRGCVQTTTVTITEPAVSSAVISKTDVSCNGGTNGTATVTASGGTAPYTYSWNTTPAQTTASISGLTAGSYTATVTDANGCTQTATASIMQPTVLVATISKTDVSCNGGNNGTATITASGGTAPYTYSWNTTPVKTTATISNLVAGSYTATIMDANGCTKTATVTVSAPNAMVLSPTHTDVLCAGGTNGTATITASGGTAPYTYSWNTIPAQTTAAINNLAAGTYTVTVTDVKGCIQTGTVTIVQPALLTAITTQTNPSCNGSTDGTATVVAGGGAAPYSYSWNTTPVQTNASISNLSAGSYTATVTDANGCTKTAIVTITQPAALTATALGNNPSCYGFTNGILAGAANGGTAPYSYSWNTTPTQNTQVVNNVAIGNYIVTVTDANNCTATANVMLTQPDSLSIVMTARDVRCFNAADGFASVVATGGTTPYAYEWNGNAALNASSYNTFSAGTQVVRVTDAKGCTKTDSVVINNATPVVAALVVDSIPCFGAATGVIRVASVSGGTPAYEYYWQGSSSVGSSVLQNLPAGSYTVRIIDQPGCVNDFTINLPEHPSQQLDAGKDSLVCTGSSITMQATGNVVQWLWTPTIYLSCTNCQNPVATPLQNTTYLLTGIDSFGCVATDSVTLTIQQRNPVSVGDSIRLCVGKEAMLSATGGDHYLWTPASGLSCTECPNPIVSDTVANNYQVIIYQGDCFTDTLYQQVVIAPLPTITVSSDVLLFSGTQITLQTTTSTNTKSVFWTPAVGLNCYNCRTPTVVDARTTTYVATAVTEYGCMAQDSIRVTVACDGSPFYVANTFTPNGDGRDDWFYPQGTGIVRINRMVIQSRWGENIFERSNFSSNEPEMGWNGTYRGQPMASGTFLYLIEAICDSGEQMILKGDINLIR